MFARTLPLLLSMLLCPGLAARAAEIVEIEGGEKVWESATLTFNGPQTSEQDDPNPFLNYRLTVTFREGEREYVVPGYFAADGNADETGAARGDKWRVHFTPDRPGLWQWQASFRRGNEIALSDRPAAGEGIAFDGATGALQVAPRAARDDAPQANGMLRYVGEHYLRYAGSKGWYIKAGADSPENFLAFADFDQTLPTHKYQPHIKDWRPGDPTWKNGRGKGVIGALNYLADQGVNGVYFLTMNVGGDGKDVWPWVDSKTRDRFDVSKLAQWEIVFSHMDRRGILLHVVTQEQENDQLLDGGRLGLQRKLYYRELIARFGHHLAIEWNLGEENTNTDSQRREFIQYISALDPYDHPIVCHTFPGKYDQVYRPLLGVEGFAGPSLQTNDTHAETLKWRKLSAEAGRKWWVCLDEIGPAHTGVKPDADDPNHDEVRRKHLWGNLMAGGGGCEWYFGYKYAHNDLNLEDFRSRENLWRQTRIAKEFFQKLPLDKMQPDDGLVAGQENWCFAQPGFRYVVYLPRGGEAEVKLPAGDWRLGWFNPRTGSTSRERIRVAPGKNGFASLGRPSEKAAEDWALLIEK